MPRDRVLEMAGQHVRDETLAVMQELHADLRRSFAGPLETKRSTAEFATPSESVALLRKRLAQLSSHSSNAESTSNAGTMANWLRAQEAQFRNGPAAEEISDDLSKYIQRRIPGFKDRSRLGLIQWAVRQLDEFRPMGELATESAEVLLAAGLGLEFLRFRPGLRTYFNHILLCDFVPDAARKYVVNSVRIPQGAGTIGWASDFARESKPSHAPLWSSVYDPKGSFAVQDLIQGVRSFCLVPIRNRKGKELGFVFCYFPIDGMFLFGEPKGRLHETTFVGQFQELVRRRERELDLSLSIESYRARFGSIRTHRRNVDREATHWRSDALRQRLAPGAPGPDDPLGFLLAVDIRKGDETIGYLRSESFAGRLNDLLQLASLYPGRWAPSALREIDCLQKLLEGHTDSNDQPAVQAVPIWRIVDHRGVFRFADPTGADGEKRDDDCYPGNHAVVAILINRLNAAVRQLNDSPQPEPSLIQQHAEAGLQLVRQSDTQADLILPLMTSSPRNSAGPASLVGFVELKFRIPTELDKKRLATLYRLFVDESNAAVQHPIGIFAELLRGIEILLGEVGEFSTLKESIDRRQAICQHFLDEFVGSFGRESFEGVSLRDHLAAFAVDEAFQLDQLTDAIADCRRALQAKIDEIPPIVGGTVWLSRERPVIVEHSGGLIEELDRDLFLCDGGAQRYLRMILQQCRLANKPRISIDLDPERSDFHGRLLPSVAERESPLLVLPPLFYQTPGGRRHISHITVESEGEGRQRTILQDSRTTESQTTICWEWKRSPEPLATSTSADQLAALLLTPVRREGTLNLTSAARNHDPEFDKQARPLSHWIKRGRDDDAPAVKHLDDLARFLAADGCSREDVQRRAPAWFAAGLTDESGGMPPAAVLAFGRPVDEQLDEFRLAALSDLRRAEFVAWEAAKDHEARTLQRDMGELGQASSLPVLLLGQSGTGKEKRALAIHKRTGRPLGHFQAVNCGALTEALATAELFGSVAGAFTDSKEHRLGVVLAAAGVGASHSKRPDSFDSNKKLRRYDQWLKSFEEVVSITQNDDKPYDDIEIRTFERRISGTLFLDEIVDLPAITQGAVLRFLDGYGFRPVGWHGKPFRVRLTIITATNRIEQLIPGQAGNSLRAELYYRIAGRTITLQPLHDRIDEAIRIAERVFLKEYNEEARLEGVTVGLVFSSEARDRLRDDIGNREFSDPDRPLRQGNYRQLQWTVFLACENAIRNGRRIIEPADIEHAVKENRVDVPAFEPARPQVADEFVRTHGLVEQIQACVKQQDDAGLSRHDPMRFPTGEQLEEIIAADLALATAVAKWLESDEERHRPRKSPEVFDKPEKLLGVEVLSNRWKLVTMFAVFRAVRKNEKGERWGDVNAFGKVSPSVPPNAMGKQIEGFQHAILDALNISIKWNTSLQTRGPKPGKLAAIIALANVEMGAEGIDFEIPHANGRGKQHRLECRWIKSWDAEDCSPASFFRYVQKMASELDLTVNW